MPFTPQPGTFYKIEDLEAAGIGGPVTIRRWIKAEKLKASLVGRTYIITGEDIRDFLLNGSGSQHSGVKKKSKVKK